MPDTSPSTRSATGARKLPAAASVRRDLDQTSDAILIRPVSLAVLPLWSGRPYSTHHKGNTKGNTTMEPGGNIRVITRDANGIGPEIARIFAAAGGRVAIADVDTLMASTSMRRTRLRHGLAMGVWTSISHGWRMD